MIRFVAYAYDALGLDAKFFISIVACKQNDLI